MGAHLLLVDDDEDVRELLAASLRSMSHTVASARNGAEALTLMREQRFDAVIADVNLPGMTGIELCSTLSATFSDLPVIMVTGHGSMDVAIAAIRAGAYDFITKPVVLDALHIAINRAVDHLRLRHEVGRLRDRVNSIEEPTGMIGESAAMRRVHDLTARVAASDASVLIIGETGTGKERVARSLHERSPRKNAPFVAINCAAMPLSLLESELFGHSRGAFTDAKQARSGLFVQAQGGTLFLDEIGDMPLEMQAKLLRALQERKVRPVGGDLEVPFDARLISATSHDIEAAVEEKLFRRDLLYRINTVIIPVPPLRSRGNDILLLTHHFLKLQAERSNKPVTEISTAVARKLLDYDWPGNVRELENCLERAVALATRSEIGLDDLPDKILQHRSSQLVIDISNPEELQPLHEMERRYIRRVLTAVGGNKTRAAQILGLGRRSLYRRLALLDRKQSD